MDKKAFDTKFKEVCSVWNSECSNYVLEESNNLFEGVNSEKFKNDYTLPKIILTIALGSAFYRQYYSLDEFQKYVKKALDNLLVVKK